MLNPHRQNLNLEVSFFINKLKAFTQIKGNAKKYFRALSTFEKIQNDINDENEFFQIKKLN